LTETPALAKEGPSGVLVYTTGLFLAVILTATSFWVANTTLLWAPGVALGLAVLAIAQMGVHLVFFLHITTAPDNTNNVLGACLWRADRISGCRGLALDHGRPEQHDAGGRGDEDADASLSRLHVGCHKKQVQVAKSCQTGLLPYTEIRLQCERACS
jgi:heme/copper-type cytochrome/quinol oxidase subunit 4